jgi:hypothetical protein
VTRCIVLDHALDLGVLCSRLMSRCIGLSMYVLSFYVPKSQLLCSGLAISSVLYSF